MKTKMKDVSRGAAIHRELVLGLFVLSLIGCDQGPQTVPVHGKVTYQGKPVPTGTVRFHPVSGGAVAVGPIQSDGSYKLARKVPGDGVLPGDYQVTIEAIESSDAGPSGPITIEQELELDITEGPRSKALVPEKYAALESTDLTASVKPGDNEINFDLE